MTTFYALFGWRSYTERQRYMEHLTPFVTSQRLHEHLLVPAASALPDVDAKTPFRALCNDVLGASRAYLAALGPMSPLVGPPLAYPDGTEVPPLPVTALGSRFASPQRMCVPVDPAQY